MEIKNLDKPSAEFLNFIVKSMQEVNPVIKFRISPEGEELKASDSERLDILEQKLDRLINKIDLIFGNTILIDGRFENLKHTFTISQSP